jgi:hypothetical protein
MIPAFSHFFLKRRRALSKDSPSFTLMPGNKTPPSLDDLPWRKSVGGKSLRPCGFGGATGVGG